MSYEVLSTNFEEQNIVAQKLVEDLKETEDALNKANKEGDLEAITSITTALDKIKMQIRAILDKDEEELSEEDLTKILAKDSWHNHKSVRISYEELPLEIVYNEIAEPVVLNVISNIYNFAITKGVAPKEKKNVDPEEYALDMQYYSKVEDYRKAMALDKDIFIQSRRGLEQLLAGLVVEYISAHAANQNTLYNTADENNYIAQIVHNFWREKINPGDREYEFMREWMQKFEIGVDFRIEALVPGEAYTVVIKEEDDNWVPLADKGMGSIQMMILLLRLATILYKYKPQSTTDSRNWFSPVIVIEEPEQNLHPKMQSYLADLFYYLASCENCKFLIETHSEYLVRKSQVIVSDENFTDEVELNENNKFKVYYLPSDGSAPYGMQYTLSGRFTNKFGEGFFDEAGKANLVTLRKAKGLK